MTINDIRDITSFKWATVVTNIPLSIKLDGDSAPLAMEPDSLIDPLTLVPGDRVRVELSLRKAIVHGASRGGPLRGTTAERNLRFGVPATDAERVALANRIPIWFNTDKGWFERYFTVAGLAGLTVGGLVAGAGSDWYPMEGQGPYLRMKIAGASALSGQTLFTAHYILDKQRGGTDWIEYNTAAGTYTLKKAGRWTVEAFVSVQAGSGDFEQTMTVNSASAPTGRFLSLSGELRATVHGFHSMRASHRLFAANDVIRHFGYSGGYNVGVGSGLPDFLFIKYEAPPRET